ncbi:MAG: acyltransferase [Rickettsiales bacterium]
MPVNNFTILRLILASLVVFGHFRVLPGLPSPHIYSYADFAVDAFFVVSGYLVYGSFVNSPKIGGFYIKRFFRIYPLYFTVIITQAITMFYLLGGDVTIKETVKYLASNLVFANFLSPDMGGLLSNAHNPAINASLWTLKIEVMFYMIVPFLYWLLRKYTITLIVAIYVLSTIFAATCQHYGMDTLAKQLPGQMRFFIMGIALYHYQDKIQINHKMAFITALILFTICSLRHDLPIMFIYPALMGFLVFICALRLPVFLIKYDISYGVYIIHAPLIQISLLLGFFENSIGFLAALFILIYSLAFCVEKTIEIPMVKLGKKLSKQFSEKFERKKSALS